VAQKMLIFECVLSALGRVLMHCHHVVLIQYGNLGGGSGKMPGDKTVDALKKLGIAEENK
jgi:hypothetical protein